MGVCSAGGGLSFPRISDRPRSQPTIAQNGAVLDTCYPGNAVRKVTDLLVGFLPVLGWAPELL